jgi:hypothetical protein
MLKMVPYPYTDFKKKTVNVDFPRMGVRRAGIVMNVGPLGYPPKACVYPDRPIRMKADKSRRRRFDKKPEITVPKPLLGRKAHHKRKRKFKTPEDELVSGPESYGDDKIVVSALGGEKSPGKLAAQKPMGIKKIVVRQGGHAAKVHFGRQNALFGIRIKKGKNQPHVEIEGLIAAGILVG